LRQSINRAGLPGSWRGSPVLSLGSVLTVVAVALVVWLLPSVLTRRPMIVDAAARQTAIANARTGLAVTLAALGAAGGLAYTARTYRLTREGHLTDRYTAAVEQLGSDKIEVRLGGLYALGRLMRDSPGDQPSIMDVVTAYIRQHAPPRSASGEDAPLQDEKRPDDEDSFHEFTEDLYLSLLQAGRPAADVQAALTVLAQRTPVATERSVELQGKDLAGAWLRGADLRRAEIDWVDLSGANLRNANLTGALLIGAKLTWAALDGADLTHAVLTQGALTEFQLAEARNAELVTWVQHPPFRLPR
jgi:Pentapeptide repeats (8 copies)